MSLCEAVGSSECAREGGRRVAEETGAQLAATGVDFIEVLAVGGGVVLLGLLLFFVYAWGMK